MQHSISITQKREIFTVSKLNQAARLLLEGQFPLIWVEGEISNCARPASGHVYFSLKDANAQVRCAMFRGRNQLLNFKPQEGQQVLARAKVSLYEGRGDFQLIVEHMEEAGDGALRRAFEALKTRLASEGLFDEARKQAIPSLPSCLGVVTSATGAAIHDIITVAKRRFPGLPIVIYPTEVQGKQSAPHIAKAIALANEDARCDVLIVGRGGGSLEDLWGFNEEIVARAIVNSKIPIISAVGHEVDVTIADFVADLRAATPSAAAEAATPDQRHLQHQLDGLQNRLMQTMMRSIQQAGVHLQHLRQRLQHPAQRLQQYAQRYDFLETQCHQAINKIIQTKRHQLDTLAHRLQQVSPTVRCAQYQELNQHLAHRLQLAMTQYCEHKRQQLHSLIKNLNVVSPLATLERGYSIVTDDKNGIVHNSNQIKAGDEIAIRLAKGQLKAKVTSTS